MAKLQIQTTVSASRARESELVKSAKSSFQQCEMKTSAVQSFSAFLPCHLTRWPAFSTSASPAPAWPAVQGFT